MSLRTKTLIFVVGTMILMAVVMHTLASSTMCRSVEIYEADIMERKLEVFDALLSEAKNNLSQLAMGWSAWDEMCNFVQTRDEKFIKKNFQNNTYQTIKADIIVIFGVKKGVVYAGTYDFEQDKISHLDSGKLNLFTNRRWDMYQHKDAKDVNFCIREIAGELYMLVSSPIVNDDYEGPINGSLVIARKIDDSMKRKWMIKLDVVDLKIEIQDKSGFDHKAKNMDNIVFLDQVKMTYDFLYRKNNQSMFVSMVANRTMNTRLKSIVAYLLSWFALTGLIFVLVVVCFLECVLFGDIEKTRKEIINLMGGRTKSPTGRLSVTGGKEFVILRESINKLLDEILDYRKKEQIHKIIIENMTDVVWVMDLNLNCQYVSQSVEKMQGWTVEERLGLSLREVVPEDSFEYLMEEFNKYLNELNTGKDILKKFPVKFKFKHYRKDRTVFWVEVIINLILDEKGNVVSFQGLERDITDRVEAEQKIKDNEEKFKAITNTALDGIAMIDENGNLMVWNPSAAKMFGYTWEEVRYQFIHDFIMAEDKHDLIERHIRDFAATGRGEIMGKTIEIKAKRKDGVIIPVELSVAPVRHNNKWYAIAVIRDISARKKAEKKLLDSESRYRKLIDMIPDGVGILVDEKIVLSNKSNLRILGYEKEEDLIGKNILSMFPDEVTGLVTDGIKKVLAGKKIENKEFKIIRLDRRVIDIDVYATSIDFDGKDAVLCIFRDISDRKKNEKEKVRLEQELKQRHKMETIGTLAGGIAHDFNNILAAIMGYLELLKDSLENNNDQNFDQLAAVNRMLKVSKRAADLVRQILTVCRKNIPNKQALELSSLIKEVIKLIRVSLPAGVTLVEYFDSSSFVLMDPVEMQQIILNLFSNASYAMKDREGRIDFTLSDQFINEQEAKIYMVQPGKYVSIMVQDQGVGIESEILERVFEPFFTTKPVGEGTGMGLAMVYSIVKSGEGIVKINSRIDEGTVVEILLPVCNRENVVSRGDINLMMGTGRILVLDDEEWFLDVTKKMLKKMGYEVVVFRNSQEALSYIDQEDKSIDLIITDYKMPDISGLKFVDGLRKNGLKQPIILCTGFGECLTREKVVEVGVTDIISKPCSMTDLSILVNKYMKKE